MITVSNSRLACFRRCPRKYKYRYVDHLASESKSPALVLGSTVHKGLEVLYQMETIELSPQQRAENAMKAYDEEVARVATEMAAAGGGDSERFEKDSYMGRQMLKYYLEEIFPTDDFTPVSSEMKLEVRVPNPGGKFSWCTFIGFIDALVERDGKLYIMEHKTAKDLKVDHLITDTQVTQYIWALRQMGYPVEGVYYNILRKVDPFSTRSKGPYHYREAVFRNDDEIAQQERELYNTYMAMKHVDRYGYYRNPTRDCTWDCDYRAICIQEMEGDMTPDELVEVAGCHGFFIDEKRGR